MSEIDENNREVIRTRSKFEERTIAAIPKGYKFVYEPGKLQYQSLRQYIPDLLLLPSFIIVELKGEFPSEDRRKLRELRRQYPNLDIRIVFQNAKVRLNKNSNKTYADWAKIYKFQYAEGTIPISWWYEKSKVLDAKTKAYLFQQIKQNKLRQIDDTIIEDWYDDLYEELQAEIEEELIAEANAASANVDEESNTEEAEMGL